MPRGICLTDDNMVIVDYGKTKIPITLAQYKANGYMPPSHRLPQTRLRHNQDRHRL